jgi:nucleotide-binding universal stress UspA family protein
MTAALPDWKSAIQAGQIDAETAFKSIVLPLDGSEQSRVALPVAQKLADLFGATMHVANVEKTSAALKEQPAELGLSSKETRGSVFEASSTDPAATITRLTQELPEALLVMSTAMGPQQRPLRFGSLTEKVFTAKPQRAVLVNPVRGNQPWELHRILLAHDGTPISTPAVGPAADLARRAAAEVVALHVAARGEDRPEARGSIAAPFYVDQPQHEWPAWAEEFMNRVVAGGAVGSGVHFKLRVTGGQAGSELADAAREHNVDLVIMAWHGHWAEHEDCATRVVVRNAGCPVMLLYSARRGMR